MPKAARATKARKKSKTSKKRKAAPRKKAAVSEAKAPSAASSVSSAKAMLSAKTVAAAEPTKDRDPAKLAPAFRVKLEAVLAKLAAEGKPFKFDEGFRTVDRQQWLYGSGRPTAKPYGRKGDIVTYKDGVKELSNHQGNGTAGSGRAADCYPMANGKIIWPPPPMSDPRWKRFAELARAQGLEAGYDWPKFKDIPHVELK
jgi:hypothetical protein